jgi:cob(I)alamin adenosyltransferase
MDETGEHIPELAVRYLNRLSDFLFVLARYITHQDGGEDLPWRARV